MKQRLVKILAIVAVIAIVAFLCVKLYERITKITDDVDEDLDTEDLQEQFIKAYENCARFAKELK